MMLAMIWVLLFGAGTGEAAEPLWLIVGASDPSPAAIARKAKAAAGGKAGGLVFDARDCGDEKLVYGWAAELAESEFAAQEALARTRKVIPSAYLKRCSVRPGSLLAVRHAAVDRSIADVPDDVVNWSDAQRISTATTVTGGRVAIVVRYYVSSPNDDVEGRRERLVIVGPDLKPMTLMESCPGIGSVRARGELITFHCATEQAADQDLHTTYVFDFVGKQIAEIPRCGMPRWLNDRTIECSAESIGPEGLVSTRAKRTRF